MRFKRCHARLGLLVLLRTAFVSLDDVVCSIFIFFSFGFSRLEFEVELSGATTYGDGHGHGDDVGGSQL